MRGVASAARSTRPCDLDDLNEAMKLATPVMSDTVTLRARGARELPRGRPVTANSGPISVGEVSGRPRQHSKAAPTLTKMMQVAARCDSVQLRTPSTPRRASKLLCPSLNRCQVSERGHAYDERDAQTNEALLCETTSVTTPL